MLVGMDDVFDLGIRKKSGRFPKVHGLRSIEGTQHKLKPDLEVTGEGNASNPNFVGGKAGGKPVKGSFIKCNSGDFSGPEIHNDNIHALETPARKSSYVPPPVFPPDRVLLLPGERTDYLSEFTRAVGGDVMLDRWDHTVGAQLFAGTKALRTQAVKALLDAGSPASFIQEKMSMFI
ncbi:unnamed protein product [Laminaria digitata]